MAASLRANNLPQCTTVSAQIVVGSERESFASRLKRRFGGDPNRSERVVLSSRFDESDDGALDRDGIRWCFFPTWVNSTAIACQIDTEERRDVVAVYT